jgi:hypothetical protein
VFASSPRGSNTPGLGARSPHQNDHTAPTDSDPAHSSEVEGARPLFRDAVLHPIRETRQSGHPGLRLWSDKLA